MNIIKKILKQTLVILVFIGIVWSIFVAWEYATYKDTREYSLIELEDGVYAYYQVVVSDVPAHNYDIVTLNANGDILTLKGNVNIHHSEDYKVIWTATHITYGDTIDVYVPVDSVVYTSALCSR